MSRLRTVGTALLGASVGYLAGTWITTYAHARARDQSAAGFVADSKHQIRANRDERTEQHPGRAPDFDHEEFSETLAPGSDSMFDPERWHSEGVGIDVVGPSDVSDDDKEQDEQDDTNDVVEDALIDPDYPDPEEHPWLSGSGLDGNETEGGDDEDGENDDDDKRGTAP